MFAENLAAQRPARQSVNYNVTTKADLAVDGNNSTCAVAVNSPAASIEFAWWQVDLGDIYSIDRIVVMGNCVC